MKETEFNVFESQINLTLMDNLISFIVKASGAGHAQTRAFRKRCIFPIQRGTPNAIQDECGFLYLGELLERYEERFGMSPPDLRAIALALGYTKDIATNEMFVGTQRADFLQTVTENAQGDIYLTGALYLLDDGEDDVSPYGQQLVEWQYTKTEELIFAVSLFQDTERALTLFGAQLVQLLGTGRMVPVLENTGLFRWLVAALYPLKKKLNGKRFALLRALLALPTSFVKEGSKARACLLEHSYTPLEIAYANMMAVYGQWIDGGLRNYTLAAEKIAVELFKTVLEYDGSLSAKVYEQLTELYQRYAKFEVKCYGERDLADVFKSGPYIQNPEIMAWFIGRTSAIHPAVGTFDIMDPRWDPLAVSLKPDVYQRLFENSLTDEMDGGELRKRIARYDALTQTSYLDRYRQWQGGRKFSLLVQAGIIDLWAAFQATRPGSDTASSTMMERIGSYVEGISTVQAFQFLQKFMPQYGYDGLRSFFQSYSDGFNRQLWNQESYRSNAISLTLRRDFLNDDPAGRLLLLRWAEEYFFTVRPASYLRFVQAVLEDEYAASLLPADELRKLFDLLLAQSKLSADTANRLKRQYFTPEEQQADQEAKAAKALEEQRQREEQQVRDIREDYMSGSTSSFQTDWAFLDNYRYRKREQGIAARIVNESLPKRLEQANGVLSKTDSSYFLRVCAKLVEHDVMSWAEAQSCILNIKEVVEDVSNSDQAQ